MAKFYYTYGCSKTQPYIGGWTEVEARSMKEANQIFRMVHPDRIEGVLNCAFVYTEAMFNETCMVKDGNDGKFCVERISINREVLE